MNIVTYQAIDTVPEDHDWIGFFEEDGRFLPIFFRAPDQDALREKMGNWLIAERAKVGLDAEMIERRKVALAAARAARKAKQEIAK